MSVAPPTEWACVVLWLIPPLQRLDGIQHTNTLDWIHHADWASAPKWNNTELVYVVSGGFLCALRKMTLRCLTWICWYYHCLLQLHRQYGGLKTSKLLIVIHSLSHLAGLIFFLFFFLIILLSEALKEPDGQFVHERLKGDCSLSQRQNLRASQTCCFCSGWGLD